MASASSNRKRARWLLENPPESARSTSTLTWEPLRLHSDNTDDDTAADTLAETRGDLEVWKGFENRIKGLRATAASERIERIIHQQLQSTRDTIQKVETLVNRRRCISLLPTRHHERLEIFHNATAPPVLGCPESPLNSDDSLLHEASLNECTPSRATKRMRYAGPDDHHTENELKDLCSNASSGSTPKTLRSDPNDTPTYRSSLTQRLFGFMGSILRRRKADDRQPPKTVSEEDADHEGDDRNDHADAISRVTEDSSSASASDSADEGEEDDDNDISNGQVHDHADEESTDDYVEDESYENGSCIGSIDHETSECRLPSDITVRGTNSKPYDSETAPLNFRCQDFDSPGALRRHRRVGSMSRKQESESDQVPNERAPPHAVQQQFLILLDEDDAPQQEQVQQS